MYGAMKTQGRSCVYSSFIPRSLRTQMKQIASSRDNLDVERVTQGRPAAILVFASKHTLREGTQLLALLDLFLHATMTDFPTLSYISTY